LIYTICNNYHYDIMSFFSIMPNNTIIMYTLYKHNYIIINNFNHIGLCIIIQWSSIYNYISIIHAWLYNFHDACMVINKNGRNFIWSYTCFGPQKRQNVPQIYSKDQQLIFYPKRPRIIYSPRQQGSSNHNELKLYTTCWTVVDQNGCQFNDSGNESRE